MPQHIILLCFCLLQAAANATHIAKWHSLVANICSAYSAYFDLPFTPILAQYHQDMRRTGNVPYDPTATHGKGLPRIPYTTELVQQVYHKYVLGTLLRVHMHDTSGAAIVYEYAHSACPSPSNFSHQQLLKAVETTAQRVLPWNLYSIFCACRFPAFKMRGHPPVPMTMFHGLEPEIERCALVCEWLFGCVVLWCVQVLMAVCVCTWLCAYVCACLPVCPCACVCVSECLFFSKGA